MKKKHNLKSLSKLLDHPNWVTVRSKIPPLAEHGETIVEILIEILTSSEKKRIQMHAVGALGELKAQSAVKSLIGVLQNDNVSLRRAAARALGDIGHREATHNLVVCLKDDDPYVREEAVRALGLIGDPTALEPLIEALADDWDEVWQMAQESIVFGFGKAAMDSLLREQNDPASPIRDLAAHTLDLINNERTVERPDQLS